MSAHVYKRILLKLSGEVLAGKAGYGIDGGMLDYLAKEVQSVVELGTQVAIVIGGGNIFRGIQGERRGIPRASGDQIGMLATVMNSLVLQETLRSFQIPTRIQSAIEMGAIAEPFIRQKLSMLWKMGKLSFLLPVQVIRFLQQIRPHVSAPSRLRPMSFSKPQKSMASTQRILFLIQRQLVLSVLLTLRSCSNN